MPVNPPSSFFLLLCRARYDALPADVKAAADANAAPLNTDAADFQPSTDVNGLKQQARMVRRRHDAERGVNGALGDGVCTVRTILCTQFSSRLLSLGRLYPGTISCHVRFD